MKLVRDGYEGLIQKKYLDYTTSDKQKEYLLFSKLHEEIRELADTEFKDPDEYGDILEVLRALAELNGVDWSDVRVAKATKAAKLGRFKKGLIYHEEDK